MKYFLFTSTFFLLLNSNLSFGIDKQVYSQLIKKQGDVSLLDVVIKQSPTPYLQRLFNRPAIEQIEINKLQDYLREEIKNYVKTYYNEKLTS